MSKGMDTGMGLGMGSGMGRAWAWAWAWAWAQARAHMKKTHFSGNFKLFFPFSYF